jgi:hypothetical protein
VRSTAKLFQEKPTLKIQLPSPRSPFLLLNKFQFFIISNIKFREKNYANHPSKLSKVCAREAGSVGIPLVEIELLPCIIW